MWCVIDACRRNLSPGMKQGGTQYITGYRKHPENFGIQFLLYILKTKLTSTLWLLVYFFSFLYNKETNWGVSRLATVRLNRKLSTDLTESEGFFLASAFCIDIWQPYEKKSSVEEEIRVSVDSVTCCILSFSTGALLVVTYNCMQKVHAPCFGVAERYSGKCR